MEHFPSAGYYSHTSRDSEIGVVWELEVPLVLVGFMEKFPCRTG